MKVSYTAEFYWNLSAEHSRYTGLGITLAIAYFIFYVNARYKFLPQISTLPATIYILLTTGLVLYQGFSYIQIATLLVAFAFAGLQEAINDIKSNSSIYSFGFLTGLGHIGIPEIRPSFSMGNMRTDVLRQIHPERHQCYPTRFNYTGISYLLLLFLDR